MVFVDLTGVFRRRKGRSGGGGGGGGRVRPATGFNAVAVVVGRGPGDDPGCGTRTSNAGPGSVRW